MTERQAKKVANFNRRAVANGLSGARFRVTQLTQEEKGFFAREMRKIDQQIFGKEMENMKAKKTKKTATIRIKEVALGHTVNMGKYESRRFDLKADVPPGMSYLTALGQLQREARKIEETIKRGHDVDDVPTKCGTFGVEDDCDYYD